jgi:iron complex transport system substrate-binding protein
MKKFGIVLAVVAVIICAGLLVHKSASTPKAPGGTGYQRFLAVSPSVEEIVFALARPEQILATTEYNRNSLKAATRKVARQIKNTLPERPGTEAIIALRPEIVFMPALFGQEQAEALRDCGFKVVQLDTPNSYQAIKQRIMLVAQALHQETAGTKLCQEMDQRIAVVQVRLTEVKTQRVAIAFGEAGAFGRTHGSFDNICREAKVVNGAGLLNLKKGEHLSKEQIISLNPDVIICSQSSERSDMYHQILNDPAFKDIKAVKNKQIVILDERYLNSTTQYFVDAVEQVAHKVYPEYFTQGGAYTVTGIDGVTVNLPEKPQRLLCSSYTFDVLTLGIVPPSRLVAVNNYADHEELSSA